jgi:hypothetical protein
MLMYRYVFGRREDRGGRSGRRRWPRSRAGGCLMLILLVIVVLVILSVMFGGFQKGTKANGLAASLVVATVQSPQGLSIGG